MMVVKTRVLLLTCKVAAAAVLFSTIGLGLTATSMAASQPTPTPTPTHGLEAKVRRQIAQGAMTFEANRGQTASSVRFLARGRGHTVFVTDDGVVLSLRPSEGSRRNAALRMRFVGSSTPRRTVGEAPLDGTTNYLRGRTSNEWITGVPNYQRVRAEGVYPGVDTMYYGTKDALEYDFIVAPNADPGLIRVAYEGAQSARLTDRGALVIATPAGEVRQEPPVIYQLSRGRKLSVSGKYVLRTQQSGAHPSPSGPKTAASNSKFAKVQVAFKLGAYDRSKPLVIDPVLWYSTYLGGNSGTRVNGEDIANDIAVRASEAYVVGSSASPNFPTTTGALDRTLEDVSGNTDAFVVKLGATTDATQTPAVIYSTFIGGSLADSAEGVAVDGAGNACLTGSTSSQGNFPLTTNAFDIGYNGGSSDAFVARLNAAGNSLLYSSYFGGSQAENGNDIAVDPSTSAIFVTGQTSSPNMPLLLAFQSVLGGDVNSPSVALDAFVARFNPLASQANSLVYSSYLGGRRLNELGQEVGNDAGHGIAVDALGNAVVCGSTDSSTFPTTAGALLQDQGGVDGFLTVISSVPAIAHSTYLGGGGLDSALDVALSLKDGVFTLPRGAIASIYVTGFTASTQFPVQGQRTSTQILQPLQSTLRGNTDAFVTRFTASGSLIWSTYLGGSSADQASSIAVGNGTRNLGSAPNVYITGSTGSTNFPVLNAISGTGSTGTEDAFITQLNATGSALVFSTYFGGVARNDRGNAIALQRKFASVDVFAAGAAGSSAFPTRNAPQPAYGGGPRDGWTAKLGAFDQPPQVKCSVRRSLLSPPNGALKNVGLSVKVKDDWDPNPVVRVFVVSDEDDLDSGIPGQAPDAVGFLPGTLRLRAERSDSGDGRVYLIIIQATDAAGNVGYGVCAVGVPLRRNSADRRSVRRQMEQAVSEFVATGTEPEGFAVVGDERGGS